MAAHLKIIGGGAAHGVVHALSPQFESENDCVIDGTFGAAGAMRDRLIAGAPADMLILTDSIIAGLTRDGYVAAGSAVDLGTVRAGIAIREGDPPVSINDGESLRAALLAADAVYLPDPKLATAGIHFAKVIDALGVRAAVEPRLRPHPNGAAAMNALAASDARRPIGSTQITEILNAQGVSLAGALPAPFELATTYTIGICSRAALPGLAERFARLLTSEAAGELREAAGFGR